MRLSATLVSVIFHVTCSVSALLKCDDTITSDNAISDLGSRTGCVCVSNLGCALANIVLNDNETSLSFLHLKGTLVPKEHNVWEARKPSVLRSSQIYSRREAKYVTYQICKQESNFSAVEFLSGSGPPAKLLKELRLIHSIFVNRRQLRSCEADDDR